MRLAKRFLGKFAGATGNLVKHIDDRVDMLADGKIGAHWFLRAAHQAICRIDVELEDIGDVGSDAAASEPGNIGQRIGEASESEQVFQCRRAINMRVEIQSLHRGAASTKVNAIATDFEAVFLIAPMENERFAGAIDDVFDHIPGKTQTPHGVNGGATFEGLIDQSWR